MISFFTIQRELFTSSNVSNDANLVYAQTRGGAGVVNQMWTGLYRGRGIPKIPKFVQTFFMDDPKDGLIRVGGRLLQSNLDEKVMHPVMLPMKGKLTEIIIRWCHQKTTHSGKNVTLNEIRTSEYWVIQSNSAEKEMIPRCYL